MTSAEQVLNATTFALYQDARWGYQFLYPEGWYRFTYEDGREGVLYAPQTGPWVTGFAVEVRDLGFVVTQEDLPDLEAGFREGIAALPDCRMTRLIHRQREPLIVLEAKYTFREGEAIRQRRSQLIYAGRRQFHVYVQGATPEDYERWRPLLYSMMMTFGVARDQPGADAEDEPDQVAH